MGLDLLLGRSGDGGDGRFYGVAVAVVTNNRDPDGQGRVRVRFPWLSTAHESDWARIAVPMAGNARGFYMLPEVDDEVLVAFEHGLIEHPYVVGALWNGQDKPPATNKDGKNNVRLLTSRSGHQIRLDDTQGSETITIADKSGKNSIVLDTAANTLTIRADADIAISSERGTVRISGATIELSATGELKADARAGMSLTANAQMKLRGTTIDLN